MTLRTWTITTGAVVLTTAMLATGSIAASAAPVTDSTASSECNFGEHMVRLWLRLPAELRTDLKDLENLEPGERGPAAREIRDGALDGEYGPGVQDRVERVRERRIRVMANMSAELKADLEELKAAAPDDRRALAEDIAQTALDGGYGTKARALAERVKGSDFWQNCVAE